MSAQAKMPDLEPKQPPFNDFSQLPILRASMCVGRHGSGTRLRHVMAIIAGLILASNALASPPPGNLGQLQKLNRESDATLERIQRRPGPQASDQQQPAGQKKTRDRAQRAELNRLQERQRRELLLLNQRAKSRPSEAPSPTLKGIDRRSRFQRQQQYQLNRFRPQR